MKSYPTASQETSHILWNPNVRCRVHNSPPLIPTLRHINPVHALPNYFRSNVIVSDHLRLCLPCGLLPSDLPIKALYVCLPSHIHATCSAHFMLLKLITRIIFGEQYRSLSSSLCSVLQLPVTLSLLGPNIYLSTFLKHLKAVHSVSHTNKCTSI